jgi:hypothetical protein
MKYDPLKAPDPKEWLSLDEGERIVLAEDYHVRERIQIPGLRAHAVIHSVVETQIAEGDQLPVKATLSRLMAEGLDRHDAIHAIGSVLLRHMQRLFQHVPMGADPNARYYAELEALTPESWELDFSEPDEYKW